MKKIVSPQKVSYGCWNVKFSQASWSDYSMIKKPGLQETNYIVGFSSTVTYLCKLLVCLRLAKSRIY